MSTPASTPEPGTGHRTGTRSPAIPLLPQVRDRHSATFAGSGRCGPHGPLGLVGEAPPPGTGGNSPGSPPTLPPSRSALLHRKRCTACGGRADSLSASPNRPADAAPASRPVRDQRTPPPRSAGTQPLLKRQRDPLCGTRSSSWRSSDPVPLSHRRCSATGRSTNGTCGISCCIQVAMVATGSCDGDESTWAQSFSALRCGNPDEQRERR